MTVVPTWLLNEIHLCDGVFDDQRYTTVEGTPDSTFKHILKLGNQEIPLTVNLYLSNVQQLRIQQEEQHFVELMHPTAKLVLETDELATIIIRKPLRLKESSDFVHVYIETLKYACEPTALLTLSPFWLVGDPHTYIWKSDAEALMTILHYRGMRWYTSITDVEWERR